MRKISLEQIHPDMLVARTVYGPEGQVLLHSGARLKVHYAKYLKRLGIFHLYVQDSRLEDVEVSDVIAEKTRMEARSLIKEIMDDAQSGSFAGKSISLKDSKLISAVNSIIEDLLSNKELIVNLADIKAMGGYAFAHSVNTCVLATLTAVKMDQAPDNIKMVALGSLLHDLGIVAIPKSILDKPGALTREEYDIVKNHPVYGYEMFKKSTLYSSIAGAIIHQHHERKSGQGYPRSLKGEKVYTLAQIVSVADVFDALTSDRPHRKAYQPHQAVDMLMSIGEEYFELDILRAFLSSIAAYPVGTHVMLSTGESGLVVGNTPGYPREPRVRILYEGNSLAPHPDPYVLDLTEKLDVVIVKTIDGS